METFEDVVEGLKMKYFVLKPRGDDIYAQASRAAMREYARIIKEENPKLAEEVAEWATQETLKIVKYLNH